MEITYGKVCSVGKRKGMTLILLSISAISDTVGTNTVFECVDTF